MSSASLTKNRCAFVRLLDGALPAPAKKRKAVKPDFESLLLLPASDESPDCSLLALGSGSQPNRFHRRAARLDARGEVRAPAQPLDLKPLYADIVERFAGLNIEGAPVVGESLIAARQRHGVARRPGAERPAHAAFAASRSARRAAFRGVPADLSILEVVEGAVEFVDTRNNKRTGKMHLRPVGAVVAGVAFGRRTSRRWPR